MGSDLRDGPIGFASAPFRFLRKASEKPASQAPTRPRRR